MHKIGYSRFTDPETTARGIGRELTISPKKAYELCAALRGRMVEDALKFLDRVITLREPVKALRYKTSVGHKRGVGPARFPVNAAKEVKKLLEHVGKSVV